MHVLEGVTYSTLSHGEGWYFLELGRHIERVQLVGRLLDLHFSAARRTADGPKYFDWLVLLKFCTAFEPYAKRLHRLDPAAEDRRIPAVRRRISPFHLFLGRPHDRGAGAGGAWRAAGAPRRGGTAGRPAEGGGGFRPDGRADRAARSPPSSPTSPRNANRSTKRCMTRISLMARRRCSRCSIRSGTSPVSAIRGRCMRA